jgi:hypothetical protein
MRIAVRHVGQRGGIGRREQHVVVIGNLRRAERITGTKSGYGGPDEGQRRVAWGIKLPLRGQRGDTR